MYTKEEMNHKEINWIQTLNATKSENYYNILPGGYNSEISYGNRIIKNKNISKALKGHPSLSGRTGEDNPISRKVFCLNTLEKFNCMAEASKKYGISISSISACCLKNRKYAKSSNEKFVFEFLTDELSNLSLLELKTYAERTVQNLKDELENHVGNNSKRVICLNTCEIFESAKIASRKYEFNAKNMSAVCNGDRNYSGIHNGEELIWEFYDGEICLLSKEDLFDYCKNKTEVGLKKIKEGRLGENHHASIKVMCVNTSEVFNTILDASKKYNIHPISISRTIHNKQSYAGKDEHGNKLHWEFVE